MSCSKSFVVILSVLVGTLEVGLNTQDACADYSEAAIRVFAEPDGFLCNIEAGMGQPGTAYVLAILHPNACDGILGTEFSITGWPEGWPYSLTFPGAIGDPGDPLSLGARIEYPDCQVGSVLTLCVIDFLATSTVADHSLQVLGHRIPNDPLLSCPVLTTCQQGSICVLGLDSEINGSSGPAGPCFQTFPGDCLVGVAPETWSRVKKLYE